MSDDVPDTSRPTADAGERGRVFVVSGRDPESRLAVGRALAGRLSSAVLVDVTLLADMVVGGGVPATGLEQLRRRLLTWSAAIAVAETYVLEGFDAVVVDDLGGDRLEEFLDLVAPEPAHVVRLDHGGPDWGLRVDVASDPRDTADQVLARLDESLVVTDTDAAT
ncbi:hypothetical protein [Terracoccus luteus]|uniref:Uncharacterized protein n=1 Tax=Terracoccus luteus TaxID=53356 RepID=A0A495Y069_9MICO|nr:hypothetical protein [Terracoccus luteus]MBB2985364.1 hypothetical protein [Terracoccus luteus]MCP2171016.1 hypothetical protein [Terracoccus luteus]RKT77378.1 hypothetical protein DFJ68_0799 [Terracoccus luteus]